MISFPTLAHAEGVAPIKYLALGINNLIHSIFKRQLPETKIKKIAKLFYEHSRTTQHCGQELESNLREGMILKRE